MIVIDVVESTALQALPDMANFANMRKGRFPDMGSVIGWALNFGVVRNERSACVSAPGLVTESIDQPTGLKKIIWTTDLKQTQPFWRDWFKGMTASFLALPVKKQLIISSPDRMDKELSAA